MKLIAQTLKTCVPNNIVSRLFVNAGGGGVGDEGRIEDIELWRKCIDRWSQNWKQIGVKNNSHWHLLWRAMDVPHSGTVVVPDNWDSQVRIQTSAFAIA